MPFDAADFNTKDLWQWYDSIVNGTVYPPEDFAQPDIAKIDEAVTTP